MLESISGGLIEKMWHLHPQGCGTLAHVALTLQEHAKQTCWLSDGSVSLHARGCGSNHSSDEVKKRPLYLIG